eukprot:CAMPEP_0174256760 /NCGR_PEP_ID=MMETSP0439-20130205/5962_1 /TAXON_ID=0 /ORGANISM="Stereomyxa ramosa, Strain Chinc5" /LENGTH=188 /DNA_ID=CAMNT_0015339519 /DNA_START=115 /DNA_END=681 /DNA_ORIENTATION=-
MTEYKIVVVGEGAVGKTGLVLRMTEDRFVEDPDPTIEDVYRRQTEVDNQTCLMDILDTAGEDEYSVMRDIYFRRAGGFLLVYSVTSRSSFEELSLHKERICRARDEESVAMVVCGNKCDLEELKQVTTCEGQELATSLGCPFFATSAKHNTNVEEAFFQLVREINKNQDQQTKVPRLPKNKPHLCTVS